MIRVRVATSRLIGHAWVEAGSEATIEDELACKMIAHREVEAVDPEALTDQHRGFIAALADPSYPMRTGKWPRFEDF
jgi:hypothetical protein